MIENNDNAFRAQLITPYAYEMPFDFWSANDIQVWVTKDGVDTQLDPTEYMVFRNQVKLKSAAYAEYEDYDSITFLRVVDATQTTDYANGMNINAELLERSLDKLTAITQQLSEVIQRCVKFSVSETGSDVTLPAVNGRANSLLGFSEDGNTMVVRPIEQLDHDIAQVAADAEYVRGKLSQFLVAEGYAVGQQNGVDVGPDSPYYHNNSKYYAEALPPMVASKADKVVPTATGNIATLDANGNLQDSQIASTVIGQMQDDMSDLQGDVSDLQTDKADMAYVNSMKLTKVWENPSPSSDFASQNITLQTEVVELLVEVRPSKSYATTEIKHFRGYVGASSSYVVHDLGGIAGIVGNVLLAHGRSFGVKIYNGSTTIHFGDGYKMDSNNGTPVGEYDNGVLIPVAVYKVGDIYNTQGA